MTGTATAAVIVFGQLPSVFTGVAYPVRGNRSMSFAVRPVFGVAVLVVRLAAAGRSGRWA
jgi:hypothetical protein